MILQFGGREIKEKDLYERIQQIWIEGYGKKAEELKKENPHTEISREVLI